VSLGGVEFGDGFFVGFCGDDGFGFGVVGLR